MAALIKVIQAMRHKIIPGIPRFSTLHDNISLKNSRFIITAENLPWENKYDSHGRLMPRRAAINNYGFSGVNAHMVIEEYITTQLENEHHDSASQDTIQVFVFSAKNPQRLMLVIKQMRNFIAENDDISLEKLAYTLQIGRDSSDCRLAVLAADSDQLINALNTVVSDEEFGADVSVYMGGMTTLGETAAVSVKVDDSTIEEWIEQNQLEKLAAQWVNDGKIPWWKLYQTKKPQRISLPGYPLEQQRYWIDGEGGPGRFRNKATATSGTIVEWPPISNKFNVFVETIVSKEISMKNDIQQAAQETITRAIARHGGMDRWEQIESILVKAYTMGGFGMSQRGLGKGFPMPEVIELRPKEGIAILYDYPKAGRQSIYDNGKVTEISPGEAPSYENDNHREKMMSVSRFRQPWTPADATYFFGYAMLHYCALPFTLPDVKVVGFKSREHGDWRKRIDIEYPDGAHTHSKYETLYFDESYLLIRHDYCPEVSSPLARAANCLMEYMDCDGYLITQRRQVFFRFGRLKLPLVVMDAGIEVLEIKNKDETRAPEMKVSTTG